MAKICMIAQSCYVRDPRVRREAEALVAGGHEVHVIAMKEGGRPRREILHGVRVYRIPLRQRQGSALRYVVEYVAFFLSATLFLSFMHVRYRYDIIHIHNMPDLLVFSALVPKLLGAVILLDVHDPMPELVASVFDPPQWVIRLLRWQERLSYKFPDALLTVSEPMRQRLIECGVRPEQIHVLLNLPDQKVFGGIVKQVPIEDQCTLIYAGTIAPRYGLDLAVKALDLLQIEMPDLRLRIVGEGPDTSRLKRLVAVLGLESKVYFAGSVDLERVCELLVASDIGISPHFDDSFWELYFSTKVVECLLAGLPVICAHTRTIAHYFDDSVLFFFQPRSVQGLVEQIRLVRSRPDLVEAKRRHAQELMRDLNWEHEKLKLYTLVENTVKTRSAKLE